MNLLSSQSLRCRLIVSNFMGSKSVFSTPKGSCGFKTAVKLLQKPVSNKIRVQDLDFHYMTVGTGKNVLVCIPGTLGFAQLDYGFLMKGIDKDKFTVVVWDPPGYGGSRPPDRDYSGNYFQRDADYLIELVKKVGIENYSVLGWSQGAVTGVHLAAAASENVENLIIFGAFACVDDFVMSDRPITRIESWSDDMKAPFLKMYGEEYLRRSWNGWAQSIQRFYREQDGDMGHRKLLKRVKCPTLIIHGEQDPIVPIDHAQYLHRNIPNSKIHIWPKGKHNLQLRYPDEFNKMVEEFILRNFEKRFLEIP